MLPVRFTPVTVSVLTAPLNVVVPCPAACVRLAAVIPEDSVTLFAFVMLIAPSRLPAPVAPTAPVNRMLPVVPAFSVSGSASAVVPSSLLANVMFAPAALPLVVLIVNRPAPPVLFKVTFEAKLTASAVVVMLRSVLIVTTPAPFCVTAPSATMSAFKLSRPALLKVTMPLPVVVIPAFTVCALPVRFTPVAVSVFSAALNVVVPCPAACVRLAALIPADSVTLFAFVMFIAPRRPTPPTALLNRMFPPVPAFSVSVSALGAAVAASSVLWNVMSPPAPPPTRVSMLTSPLDPPFSVTARAKLTASLVVLIVRGLAMVTVPVPAELTWVNAPSVLMSLLIVSVPGTSSCTAPPALV